MFFFFTQLHWYNKAGWVTLTALSLTDRSMFSTTVPRQFILNQEWNVEVSCMASLSYFTQPLVRLALSQTRLHLLRPQAQIPALPDYPQPHKQMLLLPLMELSVDRVSLQCCLGKCCTECFHKWNFTIWSKKIQVGKKGPEVGKRGSKKVKSLFKCTNS